MNLTHLTNLAYAAPFLYIVYCEFLEVAKIAPYEGINTRIFAGERSMFKCRSAHRTGAGGWLTYLLNLKDYPITAKPSETYFAVSTDERTELHVFNGHSAAQPAISVSLHSLPSSTIYLQSKPFKKRKNADELAPTGPTRKKH